METGKCTCDSRLKTILHLFPRNQTVKKKQKICRRKCAREFDPQGSSSDSYGFIPLTEHESPAPFQNLDQDGKTVVRKRFLCESGRWSEYFI